MSIDFVLQISQVVFDSAPLLYKERAHISVEFLSERVIVVAQRSRVARNAFSNDLFVVFRMQVLFRGPQTLFEIHPTFMENSTFMQVSCRLVTQALDSVAQIISKVVPIGRSLREPIT